MLFNFIKTTIAQSQILAVFLLLDQDMSVTSTDRLIRFCEEAAPRVRNTFSLEYNFVDIRYRTHGYYKIDLLPVFQS